MAIAKDADGWVAAFARAGMFPSYVARAIEHEVKTVEQPKPSKYRNKKTEIDGYTFDSKKEAGQYLDYRQWLSVGWITELRCHEAIPIVVNGVHVCDYEADFTYMRDGEKIIVDVKSKITRKLPVYRLKRKLLEALGIKITEIC